MIQGARVRLNGWQQVAVAVGSAVGALLDPRRADLIAALGETTGRPAFESVLQRMKRSPEGRVSLPLPFNSVMLDQMNSIVLRFVPLSLALFFFNYLFCAIAVLTLRHRVCYEKLSIEELQILNFE